MDCVDLRRWCAVSVNVDDFYEALTLNYPHAHNDVFFIADCVAAEVIIIDTGRIILLSKLIQPASNSYCLKRFLF